VPAYVSIYVSVDDLAASLAKAESLGATAIMQPTPIPGVGSFAMFSDPEGHVIGLLKTE
jgi:predicted enzyme related to lactoylglutathione lyase